MEIKRLDKNGKIRQEFYEYALQCCIDNIEIWVDIIGFEGLYQVSNFGNVKSIDRTVKLGLSEKYIIGVTLIKLKVKGYFRLGLCKNSNPTQLSVHRIVSINFIPNKENKRCVNHNDGNKLNNLLSNLDWCTYSENTLHSIRILGNPKPPKYG